MLTLKLTVYALGCVFIIAGWTPEGTILVITAVATILIPAIITLITTTAAILKKTKANEVTLQHQDQALDRIETKLETKNPQ